jgi:hypothetical protein
MTTAPSLLPIVFILVVVILLGLLLWFLLRDPWKQYAAHITAGLLPSNTKKIDWSPISPPDANGIQTTTGLYNLTADAGYIGIKTSGKNEEAIQEFIKEVKFYFEPIFEKIPSDPLSQLRGLLFQGNPRAGKYQTDVPSHMLKREAGPVTDVQLNQEKDLFVEFTFEPEQKSGTNHQEKKVQAIAFVVDPHISAGQTRSYWASVTGVYDTVYVSGGSVSATLRKSGSWIDGGSIGTGRSDVMSSYIYSSVQSFSLSVYGTSGTNYYTLSGTWNVG